MMQDHPLTKEKIKINAALTGRNESQFAGLQVLLRFIKTVTFTRQMASRDEKALKASLSFLKGFMDHLYIILHCINSEVVRKVSQLYRT